MSAAVAYEYVKEPGRALEIAQAIRGEKRIGLDTETDGLDEHKNNVLLLNLSTDLKNYLIDTRDKRCLHAFREVFEDENVKKITFNGINAFDYRMIKGNGGGDLEGMYDLWTAEACMTQGKQKGDRNLAAVTEKYLGKKRDKSLQKSFVNHRGDFTTSQLEYAAEDSADMLPLAGKMVDVMKSEGLLKVWRIESNALSSFGDMMFHGMKIDREKWLKTLGENEKRVVDAANELDVFFKPIVGCNLFGEAAINYNSTPEVLYGLQMMGIEVDGETIDGTDKAVQKKLLHLPVIQALMKHRAAVKLVGTYGMPYLDAINSITGRLHPAFNPYGAESGRPTCKKPTVLGVPRDLRFRNAFITELDRLISTVDYSGAELRILAEFSGEQLMIDGYLKGVDFHCYVASMLFGKEVTKKNENAHLRQPTKTLNFGLAYGMGPTKLYNDLNGEGYKISIEECRELFDKYMKTFPNAIKWLHEHGKLAQKKFKIQTKSGRVRYWNEPNTYRIADKLEEELGRAPTQDEVYNKRKAQLAAIGREGGNFPIQSANQDFAKEALYEIRKWCKSRKHDVRLYNYVYDEIVLDTPKSCAEEVHSMQKKIMVDCAHRYLKTVPMEVEGNLEPYWTK